MATYLLGCRVDERFVALEFCLSLSVCVCVACRSVRVLKEGMNASTLLQVMQVRGLPPQKRAISPRRDVAPITKYLFTKK